MTGILSYERIAAPHFGHAEAGKTMDFPSGMRTMQTFKKLPMMSPNRKIKTAIRIGEVTTRICHKLRSASRRVPEVVPHI